MLLLSPETNCAEAMLSYIHPAQLAALGEHMKSSSLRHTPHVVLLPSLLEQDFRPCLRLAASLIIFPVQRTFLWPTSFTASACCYHIVEVKTGVEQPR